MRRFAQRIVLAGALLGAFAAVRYAALRDPMPVIDRTSAAWKQREAALARAKVFPPSPGPAARWADPGPAASPGQPLRCTYLPKPNSGTTPKFDCRLAGGEVVKVKYGNNPEVPAEVAATRLLRTLGFAADEVSLVAEVECLGCPPHPYRTRQAAEMLFLSSVLDKSLNFNQSRRYSHAAVERKFDATSIEAGDAKGWQWSELDLVDEAKGGASRAELDALRLIAVLLGHWDNKPSNQRLVCLDPVREDDPGEDTEPCRQPLLMLQDLGATFGPTKLDHANWTKAPIWESDSGCVATMASLPYNGATFRPVRISEEGRQLLAARLSRLSENGMHQLFRAAGFPDAATGAPRAADVSPWVRTLQAKMAAIATHPPCPSSL